MFLALILVVCDLGHFDYFLCASLLVQRLVDFLGMDGRPGGAEDAGLLIQAAQTYLLVDYALSWRLGCVDHLKVT